MKTKILSFALLLLAAVLPLKSQACETLNLDEALRLAIGNNKTIKQSQQDKDAAWARVVQARGGFLPDISAAGVYTFTHQVPLIPIPAGSFGPNFPPSALSARIDTTFEYNAGFNGTWTLFAGGMLYHNYAAAKKMYESAEEQEQAEKQEVVYQVKKAYYNLLLASESVDVLKHSIDLASEHYRVTKDRYSAGEASELDMLNASVSLSNLQPQFIGAQNNVKIAGLALKNILGVEFTSNVCANPDVVLPEFSKDLGYYEDRAKENNYQLKIINKQLSALSDYKKLSIGRFSPTLALAGNYNWLSNEFTGTWQGIYQAELVLSIPLFNGGTDIGRFKEASSNYYKVVFLKSETMDNIKISTEAAYSNATVAKNEITAAQDALNTAEKAESIAQEQYRIGLATNLDVLNANLGLKEAQMNYIKAKYNYLLALAELERIMGTASY
ncbi:MAG: TolC family protein [Deltaproteobacteria bacterium]|nr:TolC family protein [Deltaproteobacteria bacterium]MCL5878896.1 TolC family protein [Deltaproteobacteria bacterium]